MGALLRENLSLLLFLLWLTFQVKACMRFMQMASFERKMIIYSLLHNKNIEVIYTKMCVSLILKMNWQ